MVAMWRLAEPPGKCVYVKVYRGFESHPAVRSLRLAAGVALPVLAKIPHRGELVIVTAGDASARRHGS